MSLLLLFQLDLASGAVIPPGIGPGLQDTAPTDRFHFTISVTVDPFHYTILTDRLHETIPAAQPFDFTASLDRLHFTIREEQP